MVHIRFIDSGLSPGRLHMGGQVPGDKALMGGGTHEGGHYGGGGPNYFDRLYHKLKVLLLLSCNYTMQFVSYDSIIKLVDLYLITFKLAQ